MVARADLERAAGQIELNGLLDLMKKHGSSVVLRWGMDTGQWECFWHTAGIVHTGSASTPEAAARHCILISELVVPR